MAIDWTKIKKASDIDKISKSLFDEYRAYAAGDNYQIDPDIPEEDIERAFEWLTLIPGMWGNVLILGEPGEGKSMLAHAIGFDGKYLFGKMPILDTPPRPIFGRYIPFELEFLQEELERINEVFKGNGEVKDDGRWVAKRGEVFSRNSVYVLDEAGSEWMSRLDSPNIEPKKTLLKLLPMRRHLQALFIYVGVQEGDFERKLFPHVDYTIHCSRVDEPPYDPDGSVIQIVGRIQKVHYNKYRDTLEPIGVSSIIPLDGAKPRYYLNDLSYKDLFHTDNIHSLTASKKMKVGS